MLTCIDPSNFSQLKLGEKYQCLEEFVVKFPYQCGGKKKGYTQFKEIEMVKTNVVNFLKERFDFLGLSTSQVA